MTISKRQNQNYNNNHFKELVDVNMVDITGQLGRIPAVLIENFVIYRNKACLICLLSSYLQMFHLLLYTQSRESID